MLVAVTLLAVVAAASPLEGSGSRSTELRKLAPEADKPQTFIRALEVAGNFTVTVKDTDKEAFYEVTAEQNLLPHITAVQKKDVMILKSDVDLVSARGVVVVVHVPLLERLKVSGAVQLEALMRGSTVEVTATGASQLTLRGAAPAARFDIKGAGKVDATALEVSDVVVVVGGACDVSVFAKKTVSVEGGGVGAVHVKGGGKVKTAAGGVVVVDQLP